MDLDELYRLLRSAHVQAQGIIDTIRDPLVVLDDDLVVLSANPAYFRMFQTTRDETLGVPFHELGIGQWDVEELRDLLETVIPKSAAILDYEVTTTFPDIGRRTMLLSAQRILTPGSRLKVLLITMVDATERRSREDEHDILVAELDHRLKNLLSVTQSLTRQTQVKDRTAAEFQKAVLGRLEALARSLMASTNATSMGLPSLVRAVMEPYALGDWGIDVADGPTVPLKRHQAQPLGMILHELATNAARYGALSVPRGKVAIAWEEATRDRGHTWIRFTWTETGGPTASPPATTGFGSKLIRFAAERDLAGNVDVDFRPEGLIVTLEFPMEPGRMD